MTNLQTRSVSAVVLGTTVLFITWFGGLPFRLMAVAGAALIFYEWAAMGKLQTRQWAVGAIALALILVALGLGLPAPTVTALFAACLVVSLAINWWLAGATSQLPSVLPMPVSRQYRWPFCAAATWQA